MKARSKLSEAETTLMAELLAAAQAQKPGSTFAVRVRPWSAPTGRAARCSSSRNASTRG